MHRERGENWCNSKSKLNALAFFSSFLWAERARLALFFCVFPFCYLNFFISSSPRPDPPEMPRYRESIYVAGGWWQRKKTFRVYFAGSNNRPIILSSLKNTHRAELRSAIVSRGFFWCRREAARNASASLIKQKKRAAMFMTREAFVAMEGDRDEFGDEALIAVQTRSALPTLPCLSLALCIFSGWKCISRFSMNSLARSLTTHSSRCFISFFYFESDNFSFEASISV